MNTLFVVIIAATISGLSAQAAMLPNVEIPPPGTNTSHECAPLECWNQGNCNGYWGCDNGQQFSGQCDDDLWWNPSAGVVDGHLNGQCDTWANLDEATQNGYLHDPNCIGPCEWRAAGGACSGDYVFIAPFKGSVHGRETQLSCAAGLVWAQDQLSCVNCAGRKDENDNACCGGDAEQPAFGARI